MKVILEFMGQTVICIVTAGALLVLFLTGQNAQTRELGEMVKERQSRMMAETAEKEFKAVKKGGVDFSYEEQCFPVGEPVELTQYFRAQKQNGRRIKVKIEEIFPNTYEEKGGKIKFGKEGIYEVRVSAGGYLYEVCVPVIEYAN